MHYQPVFDLKRARRVGVEALVRWQHPEWGEVSPSEFIPVAEESGLIGMLDLWVLRRVLRDVQHWAETAPPLWAGVNLSPRSFRNPEIIDDLVKKITESSLDASRLMLEITESGTVGEPARALLTLNRLKMLGVRIAIDDFGTGYSSLAYLKDLPVDSLKIDGVFVRGIGVEKSSERIVRTIIDLAHNLELSALAEGVETETQLAWLKENGCDLAQGYLLGHPAKAEELFEGSLGGTFQEV